MISYDRHLNISWVKGIWTNCSSLRSLNLRMSESVTISSFQILPISITLLIPSKPIFVMTMGQS